MAFAANIHSWVYLAEYQENASWQASFQNKKSYSLAEFAKLSKSEQAAVYEERNKFPELSLLSYTSQYGLSAFEGLKAYPQADGTWAMFRPISNCERMQRSMAGILQPTMAPKIMLAALSELMKRTIEQGVNVEYQADWEKDSFSEASAIYIRPFSYSEPGLGVNRSCKPWIVIASTQVSSYLDSSKSNGLISERIRAVPGGTGWMKCASNYVISMLARTEAQEQGYIEAIFLDSQERRYLEEGTGCNIFVRLKNGSLATPELTDTILPGITRDSVIQIAKAEGIAVEERPIPIEEVLSDSVEIFATGTAAGLMPIHGLSYKGKDYELASATMSETMTAELQKKLKGIQYGLLPDPYQWRVKI